MGAAALKLIGTGMAAELAKVVGNTVQTLAGVGTSQSGAKTVAVNVALLTTSGGATAFVLSDAFQIGDQVQLFNSSATAALIYPPSGCAFDAGSTDASFSLVQNAGKLYTKMTATSWRSGGTVQSITTLTVSGNATIAGTLGVTGAITGAAGFTSTGPTSGIGYATGAGGAVTQATNRTTAVVLNTITGTITTNNASLAAEAAAEFTVTNSAVAIGDTIILSIQSGSNGGNTDVLVSTVAAGSFKIKVANNNAAAGTAETGAILINFAVIKAVSA